MPGMSEDVSDYNITMDIAGIEQESPLSLLSILNYNVSIPHAVTSGILVPGNLTTVQVDMGQNISWCHDLQGSDFIYTPTLYSSPIRNAIAVAFILVMVITVVGNAIVIIIVVSDRPLRRITSALVVSMATTDILVAMCGELQSIIMMLSTEAWVLSDVLCEVFTSADLYFSLCGLLHIVCLAGDRYITICYPFQYERWCRRYTISSIVIAWTLPLAFSFLPIMAHWYRIGLEDLYTCLQKLDIHICTLFPNKGFSTISFIAMFALPSALMCYCYARIYKVAIAQQKRMRSMTLGAYCDAKDRCILQHVSVANGASRPVYINGSSNGHTQLLNTVTKLDYDETSFMQRSKADIRLDTNGNREHFKDSRKVNRRQQHLKKLHSSRRQKISGILGEEFRAARVISIVFLCFTITWSPYWITILIMPYLGPNEIPDPIIGAGLWLAYFGSAINPFVYYFSNMAVKKGIRRMITKVLHRLGHHNHIRSDSYP